MESLDDYQVVFPTRVNEEGESIGKESKRYRKRRNSSTEIYTESEPWDNSDVFRYAFEAYGRKFYLNLSPHRDFIAANLIVPRISRVESALSTDDEGGLGGTHCFYSGTVEGDAGSVVSLSLCQGLSGLVRTHGVDYFIEPLSSRSTNETSTFARPHIVYKYGSIRKPSANESHCGTAGHSHTRMEGGENHFIASQNISNSQNSRGHARHKRSISRDRYVEIMVVADKKMFEYHGNNLEHYILTLMAMVASVYKDPSIGNSINIVIARLENLGSKGGIKNGPKITSNAAGSLKEFCIWQESVNSADDDNRRHHDTAILLTRQDICRAAGKCDTLGLAELGTICDRKRSCAIIEDNGLSAAYTIAHELGHIFNLPHDDDVKCSDFHNRGMTKFHIMAPTLDYNTSPWTWSECSAHLLSEFIDAGVAECLLDKPRKKFRRKVSHWHNPGELYNVDKQCELLFGMGSKVCPYMPTCKRLWCTSRYGLSKGCRTQHMPWAEGTRCGASRWCHRGKCIHNTTLRKINGGWSKWQKYGNCSRPCGGGIRSAERFCDSPAPLNGGKYCLGKRKKYKSCNIKNCPPSKMDFREEQCMRFNGRFSINGLPPNVEWVPKYSGILLKDVCKLFCRASTSSAYYQLKDKVIDGTKCGPDTTDICVNGKCRRAGCDNRLGSDMRRDKCGVCGGDNSSCRTITGTFNKVKYGYNFVTKIPSGALNIDIRQYGYGNSKDDDNYLVLMNSDGEYMLNGNYIVSMFRRHIKAHGATIEYSGSDTEMERVNATDVLQEDLNLMVLSVGKLYPPDIRFSYSVSVGGMDEFQWNRKGPWGTCSHICSGRKRRKIICEHKDNGLIVSDEMCKNKGKPKQASSKCNKHCTVSWQVVYRGECDSRCGQGQMRQLVRCMKTTDTKEELVDEIHCHGMGPRPPEITKCFGNCHATHWMYFEWSKCSKSCGGGEQKRMAKCVNDQNKMTTDRHCRDEKIVSQPCNQHPCAQWESGDWTGCSVTCGSGQRHRKVMCKQGGKEVRGDYCSRKDKPSTKTGCKLEPCPGWFSGAWGGCSVTCGQGTRMRAVRCRSEDGQFLHDSICDAARKPRDSEPCLERPCSTAVSLTPATPISPLTMGVDWRFGSWTQCSASCGEGTRMRYVGCADANGNRRPVKDCSHVRKPDAKELCLARPCGHWRTGEWGECSNGCSQTRYVACMLLDRQMGVDKDCDMTVKPLSEQKCNRGDCLTAKDFDIAKITSNRVDGTSHWRVGPWTDCSVTCGMGWQRRQVICQDEKGRSKDCGEDERPEDVRHCNQGVCPRWNYGRWGQCSKSCGDGVRRRMVMCQFPDGQTLSDANCDILIRPSSEEQCKKEVCQSAPVSSTRQWWSDQFSRCSVSCGVGVREREVKCLDDDGNQRPDEECPGLKPKASKKCKRKKCPKWFAGPWSRCSVTCGVGTKHRDVQCRLDKKKNVKPSQCSKAKRPVSVEQCAEGACSDYEWRNSPWSECSRTCGFGMKTRHVSCVNKHADKVSHQFCDQLTVPKSVRRCSEIPCPFIWNTGDWTTCSTTCGEGKQTRRVVCQAVSKEGWILPGEVSYACKTQERPPGVQYCNYGDCQARHRWMTGPWGQCTKTCGKGRVRRKVICVDLLGNKQRQRNCVAAIRPKRSQSCYLGPCYAKSCKQLKEVTRIRQDGEYKLLVHGRFIEVYCKRMRKADPKEYITLPIGVEENYAEIYDKRLINPASCPYNGTRRDVCMACHKRRYKVSGHTVFNKLRMDLRSLKANIKDFAFTKTLNGKRIPFATAGDCYSGEMCPQGKFSIDLTGTGLVVARNTTWVLQGHRSTKNIQMLRNGEVVRGVCGGNCGRCSPEHMDGLQLELRP